jgi:hypothetical protein
MRSFHLRIQLFIIRRKFILEGVLLSKVKFYTMCIVILWQGTQAMKNLYIRIKGIFILGE